MGGCGDRLVLLAVRGRWRGRVVCVGGGVVVWWAGMKVCWRRGFGGGGGAERVWKVSWRVFVLVVVVEYGSNLEWFGGCWMAGRVRWYHGYV